MQQQKQHKINKDTKDKLTGPSYDKDAKNLQKPKATFTYKNCSYMRAYSKTQDTTQNSFD